MSVFFCNLSVVTSFTCFLMKMGESYFCGEGFTWGVSVYSRPISGCCRFFFFRLMFSSLSEAFEGRLPRRPEMVDGKFVFFTSLKEKLISQKT